MIVCLEYEYILLNKSTNVASKQYVTWLYYIYLESMRTL